MSGFEQVVLGGASGIAVGLFVLFPAMILFVMCVQIIIFIFIALTFLVYKAIEFIRSLL